MRKTKKKVKDNFVSMILLFVLIICIIALAEVSYETNSNEYLITVVSKSDMPDDDGDAYHIIGEIKENGKTVILENKNDFLQNKYNSSDIQQDIKVNATYKVKAVGFDLPGLAMYQNIVSYERID